MTLEQLLTDKWRAQLASTAWECWMMVLRQMALSLSRSNRVSPLILVLPLARKISLKGDYGTSNSFTLPIFYTTEYVTRSRGGFYSLEVPIDGNLLTYSWELYLLSRTPISPDKVRPDECFRGAACGLLASLKARDEPWEKCFTEVVGLTMERYAKANPN